MRLALVLLAALLAAPALAQVSGVGRPLVVMNLAAHPDDEDGLTLAYYRGNQDAAVYSVVYTRGEGGQNEIGPDLYERLGAIRTAETEAAARVLGTQVVWLNFYDFGFTKHAAEAFDEWSRPRRGFWDELEPPAGAEAGREAVTAALVEQIRRYKPDVLFTNHDTVTVGPGAQHGQHQAVGISAYEAFARAADPAFHPEQLAQPGVDLWQPKRLFLRVGGFDGGRPRQADVAVPVRDVCAAHVTSPEEACNDRAVRAAALHASQGFGAFAPRFRRDSTYFVLLRQSADAAPLPAHATDLAAGLAPRRAPVALRLPHLIDAGRATPLAGLASASPVVVPGDRVAVSWDARRVPEGAEVVLPTVRGLGGPVVLERVPASAGAASLRVGRDAEPTRPAYRQQYERHLSGPPLIYTVERGGEVIGAGYLPIEIVPAAEVDLPPGPIRLVPGRNAIPVRVHVYEPMADTVDVGLAVLGGGRVLTSVSEPVAAGDTAAVVAVTLPEALAPGAYRVQAETHVAGCGLPWFRVSRPAAVLPDVSVAPGLRVGFVQSYDGSTADALRTMGADVTLLDSTALASGDLSDLDTIVIDIRAYLDRADLRAHNDRLLAWTRNGGHLVVGYHKTFEWNGNGYAPVPLTLSRDRITDEHAPVTVLQPASVLFHTPHEITPTDWDGWVQERGLYFPADDTDARYTRLLAMADPGEAPLTTGLLLATVGRGTYAYTALGWYRQLEALNPGAWRLFANLVSLPLTDGRDGPLGAR